MNYFYHLNFNLIALVIRIGGIEVDRRCVCEDIRQMERGLLTDCQAFELEWEIRESNQIGKIFQG